MCRVHKLFVANLFQKSSLCWCYIFVLWLYGSQKAVGDFNQSFELNELLYFRVIEVKEMWTTVFLQESMDQQFQVEKALDHEIEMDPVVVDLKD